MSVLARRSVLDEEAIVLLRPITIGVGSSTIEVVPRIVGDETLIDIDMDLPIGPIKANLSMSTHTFSEAVELARRHNVIPTLSALVDRATGMKPKLLK